MLGNTQMAQGDADPYTMTEVDVLPQPETSVPEPEVTPEPEVKQPMITQDDEPSIQVKKEKPPGWAAFLPRHSSGCCQQDCRGIW